LDLGTFDWIWANLIGFE